MTILFLDRHGIDDEAWDACVMAAPHRLVYGYSWYLDAVTSRPDWSWAGLVVLADAETYAAVMPVPLRRKWGRWVVHQPLFCQTLGVFARMTVSPDLFSTPCNSGFGTDLFCTASTGQLPA